MQPTDTQVQCSLAALRHTEDLHGVDAGSPHDEAQLPLGLVERLERAPSVRTDRLAEARERLAAGEVPTADDLANRMVGRLVCDRLR